MDANVTLEILTLLMIVGGGLALGKLSWRGFSFGTSGVLFIALAAGHYQLHVPSIAGAMGVVLFVFCLGLGAGPGFLRVLLQRGQALAILGVTMIASAAITTLLIGRLCGLPPDLTGGLFAGALTSTPALAAASESLPPDSQVAIAFGAAYPVGVLVVLLFVQVAPRFLPGFKNADYSGDDLTDDPIVRQLAEVLNPGVSGERLSHLSLLEGMNCQVSRVLRGDELAPVPADFRLEIGQHVLLVGARSRLRKAVDALGKPSTRSVRPQRAEQERRRVVVTSKHLIAHSLKELHLLSRYGVTVSRITRHDIEFVPGADERIQFGDALTVVGEVASIDRFIEYAGHRERSMDETDLISLCVGLIAGVLLGRVQFAFGENSVSLGLAGGPLVVGLLLGHFGRVGPVIGHMPRAARLLLTELGLTLFLAHAGVRAGEHFVEVVMSHGAAICSGALLVVAVPVVLGSLLARAFLGISPIETLGAICGALTSTPGLGALNAQFDSNLPATSYAAVYPLALIVVTILAPMLVSLM